MRAFVQAVHDASAIHGELKRMFLSAGIVALIAVAAWGVQEWGARKSAVALGWFGVSCMGAVAIGAATMIAVGLL
jgi:hypothetical protein